MEGQLRLPERKQNLERTGETFGPQQSVRLLSSVMLLVDKYRPQSLKKVDYHTDLSEHLLNLVRSGQFQSNLWVGCAPSTLEVFYSLANPNTAFRLAQMTSRISCFTVLQEQARRPASWPC